MNTAIRVVFAVMASFVSTSFVPLSAEAGQPASAAHELNPARNDDPPPALSKDPLYQARQDWGCEVLLCLANPDGPTAVEECVPPIHRLRRALAHGHPFPRCTLSNGQDSRAAGTWVQRGFNYYDRCPAGTTALALGLYAMQPDVGPKERTTPLAYTGIGDGSGFSPFVGTAAAPPLVCVGNRIGIGRETLRIGCQWRSVVVTRYDKIVLLQPTRNPRVFDVYVDNDVYQRARW